MSTQKQRAAARKNIKKAQRAARSKRTIAHLAPRTRRALVREAQKARRRGGQAGHALEDRSRSQLYEVARRAGIARRSKMGKAQLIRAIRSSR